MDFVSKKFDFTSIKCCVVIGEIGVNHNRQEELLFKLIDEGITAGVDIIKLQRFVPEDEITTFAPATAYQMREGSNEGQLALAKALALPDDWLIRAYEYCKEREVGFLCTAFDHSSVDFVAKKLGCTSVKVPSPDITNRPLLQHMARSFQSLLISTGASYLSECGLAIQWIEEIATRELALMHCVSEYPAPVDEANLRSIITMRESLGLPVGFSDHTEGQVAGVVAAGLGAVMIEKHFTLDKGLPGPDHKASINIDELKQFVRSVREASACLGDGIKQPAPSEIKNRPLIRKCVVCSAPQLPIGTVITANVLKVKRPYITGAVEPCDIEKICGIRLLRKKQFDEPILWTDFR